MAKLGENVYKNPVILDHHKSDSSAISFLRFHACAHPDQVPDIEHCLLSYMANPTDSAKPSSYLVVLSSATVLEPTALEKLWLYLFLRPKVKAVRPLAYAEASLRAAVLTSDPMQANVSLPSTDPNHVEPIHVLPLMYTDGAFVVKSASSSNTPTPVREHWLALLDLIQVSRLMRIPLFTAIDTEQNRIETPNVNHNFPTLSLHHSSLEPHEMPPHLWSEHAFYKWSARMENAEMYSHTLETWEQKNAFDFWGMPFRKVNLEADKPRVFFVMPWMQMGGSEKSMLDLAKRFVKMEWPVTFVLTMPFWHEDKLGELGLQHEWMNRALSITSDVFDVVGLAPNHKFSKVLRYLVETRSPDYVLTANSRIVYEHVRFIKALSPNTLIADYNHMVHMNWEVKTGMGGGMPRYGTTYSEYIDLHLTASNNVTRSMKSWMDSDVLVKHPEKVKTCYIGTDPAVLHSDESKSLVRSQMRRDLEISPSSIVILFAGRFVADKGIDVMADVLTRISQDTDLASRLTFVFVGSGEQKDLIETTQRSLHGKDPAIIIQPPAVGVAELRNYYAMADVFLLPSTNEGIALVLYEAMASGMLVMATDVGGQNELVRTNTGVLLPNLNSVSGSSSLIVRQLQAISKFAPMFKDIQEAGTAEVRQKYTTEKFCDCVIDNMVRVKSELEKDRTDVKEDRPKKIEEVRTEIADVMRGERVHGEWNRKQVDRSIEGQVTIGIKTYVCDPSIVRQVVGLVRSIRVNYPNVRILLANDGPTAVGDAPMLKSDPHTEEIRLAPDSGISIGRNIMVNMTTTKYFVLLDDDHVFDEDTDLGIGVRGISIGNFDIVGIRVRNLPGIEELERISIFIPRYVAKVSKFENREVTLCVWNENNGPGVQSMRVPIRVDVLHNALIGRTDVLRAHPWRNELKVNEHMTFFLDARAAGVKVGYLPSVFVHHRARRDAACYNSVRRREDVYEQLLEYKNDFNWDVECGNKMPQTVSKHIEDTKGMS